MWRTLGLTFLLITSATAQTPSQLYGYTPIPVWDSAGNPVVHDGKQLFTWVCFVTLNSAQNGILDVPVAGYPSRVTHYAVRQDIDDRWAEVIEADMRTEDGLAHFVGLSIPMRLSATPPPSRCSPEEWYAAGNVRLSYRTREGRTITVPPSSSGSSPSHGSPSTPTPTPHLLPCPFGFDRGVGGNCYHYGD